MGMSTHVIGFIPPDAYWNARLAVYNSCKAAGVPVPKEVDEFFGYEDPTGKPGRAVDLVKQGCAKQWFGEAGDAKEGFEINVDLLPPTIKTIRFYNSY